MDEHKRLFGTINDDRFDKTVFKDFTQK